MLDSRPKLITLTTKFFEVNVVDPEKKMSRQVYHIDYHKTNKKGEKPHRFQENQHLHNIGKLSMRGGTRIRKVVETDRGEMMVFR